MRRNGLLFNEYRRHPGGTAMTPYKCPVCHGHGTVSKPPWVAGDQRDWVDSGSGGDAYACRACHGSGIVNDETSPCSHCAELEATIDALRTALVEAVTDQKDRVSAYDGPVGKGKSSP